MKAQPLTSASHAKAILSAWNGEDTAGFQRELNLVRREGAASDALEAERMELLAGIAAELAQKGASTGVCKQLLRHLAATPSLGPRATLSRWAVQ